MSEKKICPKCGEEIEEDADTCPFCGVDLTEAADEDDWMDMLSDLEGLEELEDGAEPISDETKAEDIDDRLDDLLDSILVDTDGSRVGGDVRATDEDDASNLPDAVVVEATDIEEIEMQADFEGSFSTEESEVSDTEDSTDTEIISPEVEEVSEEDIETSTAEAGLPEETEIEEAESEEGEEVEEAGPEIEAEEEYEEEEIEDEKSPETPPKKERKEKSREKSANKERSPKQRQDRPSPMIPPVISGIGFITFLGATYGFYSSTLNSTTAGLIMMVAAFISAAGVNMKYSQA